MFKINFRIYYEDTDAAGIVYYANYLRFLERARTEYLRSLGYAKSETVYQENPFGFAIRKVDIEYLRSALLDDLITVTCEVKEVTGATIVCKQQVLRGQEVLAEAQVVAVYMSYHKQRPMRIPADLAAKF